MKHVRERPETLFETFANQNLIVTGAASGIGLATARLLKQHGANVTLWDRDVDGLKKAAAELDAQWAALDISQPDMLHDAMAHSIQQFGTLDGVIHCAGILSAGLFESVDLERQQQTVMVNLFGTIALTHTVLPHLKISRGSLVLLASSSAFYGTSEYAVYGASKAGVLSFAQTLRVELSGSGVHVGVVSPLFVSTPMLQGYNGNTRMIRSRSPFFETQTPEAVAADILKGIGQHRFMIYPGWRTRFLFWMSRYTSMLMHPLAHMTYRQGGL